MAKIFTPLTFQINTQFKMSGAAFIVSEQKLSEKLLILKERGIGMLTRIYNIKKGKTNFQHLRKPNWSNFTKYYVVE